MTSNTKKNDNKGIRDSLIQISFQMRNAVSFINFTSCLKRTLNCKSKDRLCSKTTVF